MNAIELTGASRMYKTRRGTTVGLHDLSFSVAPREIVALIGPNGAGKTTALKIVATLARPATGNASVFGHDTVMDAGRVRQDIGYVAQSASVDSYATVLENLYFQAAMQKMPRAIAKHRIDALIEQFTLREITESQAYTLSGGQRRRLDIAMGLIHEPKLLLLDEPTANLDPDSRLRLWEVLNKANRDYGLTILFATHNLDEADQNANTVVFIDKGRRLTQGSPLALKNSLGDQNLLLAFADATAANAAGAFLKGSGLSTNVIVAGSRVIACSPSFSTMDQLFSGLTSKGLAPGSATLSGPTLEDVYLKITGNSFEFDDLEGRKAKQNKEDAPWEYQ